MTLSYNETNKLIDLILTETWENARIALNVMLKNMNRKEPEFCMGVIEHGRGMSYTSEQWADFLSKVPNILFRDEHWLMNKLSPVQRQQLGLE